MEFLFAGCENLVEIIGLESLNTNSIKYTSGMFLDCKNLQHVNLTAFNLDSVEEQQGMFVNTSSLQIVDLGNCTDANNLFDKEQDFNLIIVSNETINISSLSGNFNIYNQSGANNISELLEQLECIEGEGEKCLACDITSEENMKFCGVCNDGYYLPLGGQYSRTKCKKCDEACLSCYAEENSDISICTACDYNYNLYQGRCIEYCDISYYSNCHQCKSELEGKNDECLFCNEGYYLDLNYSKTICKKIEIENCTNATVENGIVKCLNCSEGNMLYKNKCYETCKTGRHEECKTCNTSFEYRFYCGSCNPYYYLRKGIRSTECFSCEIYGCSECEFIAGEEVCTKCIDQYTLINGKCYYGCCDCKSCFVNLTKSDQGICSECKTRSYLKNYEEYKYGYLSETTSIPQLESDDYLYNETNSKLYFRNYTYGFCNICPEGCETGAEKLNDEYDYYCFSCYEGYNFINYTCNDIQCTAADIPYFSSCKTCDKNEKYKCASCNIGYFLNKTTGRCIRYSDNCAKCNNQYECLECKENYEVFNNRCAIGCIKGEGEKCKECNPKHPSECGSCNKGYFLPLGKQKCKKCPDNCDECEGTIENITCTKCPSIYYEIIEDRCYVTNLDCIPDCPDCGDGTYRVREEFICYCKICGPNIKRCHSSRNKMIIDECFPGFKIVGDKCLKYCETGIKEKCLSCKTEKDKLYQCAEYNKGYFMPIDYDYQDICFKCNQEGCIRCSGTISNNICLECHPNYKLFEGQCVENCDIGDEFKCLTCNEEPGKNNRCQTCNDFYYLPTYSTDIYKNMICQKCPDFCLKCEGDFENPKCTECISGYLLRNGICIGGCDHIKNCLICDDAGTYPICTKCHEGFYFPMDLNKYYDRCYRCSLPGCLKCEGDYEYDDYCLECKSGYDELLDEENVVISCSKACEIGSDNKCKSCSIENNNCGSCNDGFYLEGGMCLIKDYDIIAEYETQDKEGFIKLMNSNCIKYMIFDGLYYDFYPFSFIHAGKPGIYKAYIKFSDYCSYPYLFANNNNIKNIVFFDNFNSLGIDLMNEGFYNSPNLESVDMSNLNLGKNRCFMNYFANDV